MVFPICGKSRLYLKMIFSDRRFIIIRTMELLSISFNQDSSALAVGARKTFNLFNLPPTDDVNKMLPENVLCTEDVIIVERLFSSSLITYVTAQNPRRLQVCHYQKQQEICHQMYPQKILSVRLNRTRLVVCLEESLFIHNIKDMKILHTIKDTPPNMLGVADLCSNDISYLAYPGSLQIGEVQVYDACNLQAVVTIQAHSSRIAALKFNEEGTKLATASEKGTVIKVFLASKGTKLFEFRRGMKRNATIHSMGFSPDSVFLCCSSSTETVHVFKLDPKEERKIVEDSTLQVNDHQQQQQARSTPPDDQSTGVQAWFSYVGKTAASYMPTAMSDVFQQDRAFAQARLPQSGYKNVGALAYHRQKLRLMVASLDGYLYLFDFNKDEGGDCQLIKSHRLVVTYPQAISSVISDDRSKNANSSKSYSTAAASTNSPLLEKTHEEQENETLIDTEKIAAENSSQFNVDDDQEFPPVSHKTE